MSPRTAACLCAAVSLVPVGAGPSYALVHRLRAAAGHRWVHHADMDADGVPDRIVITAGRHLHVEQSSGTGHYTVRVRLSSTGRTVSRRLDADDYFTFQPAHHGWTPWYGQTILDHVGGKEILLGERSGASSSTFYALAYTEGRLVVLPSPDPAGWNENSDADIGNGFRCTRGGVETGGFFVHGRNYRKLTTTRSVFVWYDDAWHRTRHVRRTYRNHEFGNRRKSRLAGARCPGLPKSY